MRVYLTDLRGRAGMELRVLRYFLTVAREGKVTSAANALHLTQPTLSRQIKELEEELGRQLLIRGSHSVALTPDGMLLRKRAEEILDMVEKTQTELSSGEEGISGEIRIGGGETPSMRIIAEIIKETRADYPDIHFHIHSGIALDVAERLDKGLLDFGFLVQPVDVKKYEYLDLPVKDVWAVLMRKDHPLAKKKTIRPKDLVNEPLLLTRKAMENGIIKSATGAWFGKRYESLTIVVTYNLIYNAALLVEQGIGCALTIDGLANTTADSPLCSRLLEPKLETGFTLVWKKHQVFSPAAQVFLKRVQEKFSS